MTPIRTSTDTAGKPIKVGANPAYIAITPNGKTAYVANTHSGTVTPIQIATNTAGKAIKVAKPITDGWASRSPRTGRPPTSCQTTTSHPAR